jgi:hypothetical protein
MSLVRLSAQLSSSASSWLLNPLLLVEAVGAPHSSFSARCWRI